MGETIGREREWSGGGRVHRARKVAHPGGRMDILSVRKTQMASTPKAFGASCFLARRPATRMMTAKEKSRYTWFSNAETRYLDPPQRRKMVPSIFREASDD